MTTRPPPPGSGTAGSVGTGSTCGVPDPAVPQVAAMEPIAVAFDGSDNVVVQSREPALLVLRGGVTITLSTQSRLDTGHRVFHSNAGGFLACASCHAEGNDDGRVWDFTCAGKRRTQSLQTGLRGTEPFHWSGDETDFSKLMNDVFVGRMSGPSLATDQTDALFGWIDAQPRPLRTAAADPAAVTRGQALFSDPAQAACATCHAGAKFTNAKTVDVGTGGAFQVPSLVGVGSRGPFMHDGCAKSLQDRFGDAACGGGDKHGVTSSLTPGQISDLVAFLNTI
jgi:mono/diheme cytochrome c family protein